MAYGGEQHKKSEKDKTTSHRLILSEMALNCQVSWPQTVKILTLEAIFHTFVRI